MEQIHAIGDLLQRSARFPARVASRIPVRLAVLMTCAGVLAACEIVDTGPTRIGGVSCGWSDAGPATPEYHRCRSRNADEGVRGDRRPGGGVGF